MLFEKIVDYIENTDKLSDNEAIEFVDNFIEIEFRNKDIKDVKYLFYILVMINIRNVKYNEYTEYIHTEIINLYKKSSDFFLGLQLIEWYKKSDRIKKCIDYSLKEINCTLEESNLHLLNYLLSHEYITESYTKLLDYIVELISSVENFDFNIYKIAKKSSFSKNYSEVIEYITKKMKKNTCSLIFENYVKKSLLDLKNQKNKFDELDEIVSFYLRNDLSTMQLNINFEKELDALYLEERDDMPEPMFINYIQALKEICENHNIDFYTTNTCKETIYNCIFRYKKIPNPEIEEIVVNYLKKNKDKVLEDKTTYNIVNACISKILPNLFFDNTQEETIGITSKNKIEQYIRLTKDEKEEFIKQISSIKINNGILPSYVCKYIIYCIIQFNEYDNIKECILCDLATNIERDYGIYYVMNYIEEDDEMLLLNGKFHNHKFIVLSKKIAKNFSRTNIEIIDTLYHEIEHLLQDIDIKNKNYTGNRYNMHIEKIISTKIKDYNKLNYYIKYNEIEARMAGALGLQNFLKELNIDSTACFIYSKTSAKEYIASMLNECTELLKTAHMKYINKDEKKDVDEIWSNVKDEFFFDLLEYI